MKNMKHTQGEWKVKQYQNTFRTSELFEIESDGKCVASCDTDFRTTDEAEANAKLIASAPESIDRLIHTTDYLKLMLENKAIPEGTKATIKEFIFWNEKQIKKATT